MDSKTRRNRKLKNSIPTADPRETEALIELLFEATKENSAHCCRLLGVSRPTWRKWAHTPPTEWYWPMVLRAAIKHTLSSIISVRRATSSKWRQSLLEAMSKVPRSTEFEDEIAEMAYDIRGAEKHLRTLLARAGMWWSEIQKAANCGGYSKATLRKASRTIGIVKKQQGYGDQKDSFWRLPEEDDD